VGSGFITETGLVNNMVTKLPAIEGLEFFDLLSVH